MKKMVGGKKTVCRICCRCKMTGRANRWNGRGNYYCFHPAVKEMPQEVFGNKERGFICFGTAEVDTKPQIKTRPGWCPLSADE